MPGVGLPLYRALLKECRRLQAATDVLQLRKPLQDEWGSHSLGRLVVPDSGLSPELVHVMEANAALEELVPGLEELPADAPLTIRQLRRLIRVNFDEHRSTNHRMTDGYSALDQGFAALRALPYQGYLHRSSSSSFTHNILVEATAAALAARPSPRGAAMYPFSYRVRVTNLGDAWVQLLGRAWVFKDGGGNLCSVVPMQRTNAIVGQQPRLPPGGGYFEYTSGVPLPTPSGSMAGSLVLDLVGGPQQHYEPIRELTVPVKELQLQQPGPVVAD